MRRILLFLFCIASFGLSAQDYLVVPSTNPSFFPKQMKVEKDKLLYQVDSVVYEYDTLQLPFVDDFTDDHFPPLIKDPANDPRVQSVLYHAILINGQVYSGDGFTGDSTFTFVVDTLGDTISTTVNQVQVIQFYRLDTYPPQFTLENVFPPYDVFDTLGVGRGSDTIFREATIVQDTARYYVVEKDTTSYYLNRSAYRNFTMGFYPPSMGVATFDGLNQYGLPYNFNDISQNGRADELTSVPINLEGATDSTYFSFFYQAKGFALDGPEPNDSLSLQFYNSNIGRWGTVWNKQGITATTPVDSFQQVLIRVDSQFRTNGFQFRFRNLARLDGAYDNWHIDYIYLDDNRSIRDTAQKDISFVYRANSLLKEYQAMPVWHFKTNPAAFMTDTVRLLVRNNFSGPLNVFNKIIIPDTINSGINYIFPGPSQFLQIKPFGSLSLKYPLNFTYPPSDIDSFQIMKGICDIDFRPAPIETKDFIRANDTTISPARLTNYYAYDDGTAEAGYGVENGSQGGVTAYLAVRFDMPFQDTLGGVDMYFLPQTNDIRTQSFILTVWSSLSPATILYQKEVRYKAIYDEKDAYISYFFDSLVVVGPTFYVGYQKIGARSMNLGYDLNINHKDKIYFSLDGSSWYNPSPNIRDGSLMLRPLLRKKNFGVGLAKNRIKQRSDKGSLSVFPNPVNHTFGLLDKPEVLVRLELLSFEGRSIREFDPNSNQYSIEGLSNGMYLLRALDNEGRVYTTKIIIQH